MSVYVLPGYLTYDRKLWRGAPIPPGDTQQLLIFFRADFSLGEEEFWGGRERSCQFASLLADDGLLRSEVRPNFLRVAPHKLRWLVWKNREGWVAGAYACPHALWVRASLRRRLSLDR
jgi:hypothetical protein